MKSYGRDEAGRMTSLTLAADATPVREITYSDLGVPLRVISHPTASPTDDITVSYAWDAAARMVQETDGAGQVWTCAYNPQGLLASSRDPLSNTTTVAWDLEGRMVRTETAGAGENLASFTEVTYAPAGEIASRAFSDRSAGSAGSATETYAYDAHGRLSSARIRYKVTEVYLTRGGEVESMEGTYGSMLEAGDAIVWYEKSGIILGSSKRTIQK